MFQAIVLLVLGCVILLWGADQLVKGSSNLALRLGLSSLFIGLTIVAFGTSTPELTVSIISIAQGTSNLAIGNIVGSNIANILVIIGLCAVIKALTVNKQVLRFDLPVTIASALLLWLFSIDGYLRIWEGGLLTLAFLAYIFISFRLAKKSFQNSQNETSSETETPTSKKPIYDVGYVLVGLIALIGGSRLAVMGAVDIAAACGVSELLIGLTVVAVGTSLPEIAASSVATFKGKSDIAIGNVLGSNISNTFLILGVCALYGKGSLEIDPLVLSRDLPIMVGATLICLPIFFTSSAVVRWEGIVLLFSYVLYVANCALHDPKVHHTTPILTQISTYFIITLAIALFISTLCELKNKYQKRH